MWDDWGRGQVQCADPEQEKGKPADLMGMPTVRTELLARTTGNGTKATGVVDAWRNDGFRE